METIYEQEALRINSNIDPDLLRVLRELPHHVILATVVSNLDDSRTHAGEWYANDYQVFNEAYNPLRALALTAIAVEVGS